MKGFSFICVYIAGGRWMSEPSVFQSSNNQATEIVLVPNLPQKQGVWNRLFVTIFIQVTYNPLGANPIGKPISGQDNVRHLTADSTSFRKKVVQSKIYRLSLYRIPI